MSEGTRSHSPSRPNLSFGALPFDVFPIAAILTRPSLIGQVYPCQVLLQQLQQVLVVVMWAAMAPERTILFDTQTVVIIYYIP